MTLCNSPCRRTSHRGGVYPWKPFLGSIRVKAQGGDGEYGDAVLVDEKGVLVPPMGRAAVFDHPETARRYLVGDPVIEEDHAVRHVLFETVTGEGIHAPLSGNDGGHTLLLEPAEEAPKLCP